MMSSRRGIDPSPPSPTSDKTRQRSPDLQNREIELKLATDAKSLARLRTAAPLVRNATGQATTTPLRSVYYDTEDRRLSRRGIALRVRSDGKRYIQTIKSKGTAVGALSARGEWETEVDSLAPRPDRIDAPELRARLGLLRPDALKPLFETKILREERTVEFTEGGRTSLIAVALDSGEIKAGEVVAPVAELELELQRGQPSALVRLALELLAHAPLQIESRSKAARGYALADGEAPAWEKGPAIALTPAMPVATAMADIFSACLGHWTANQAAAIDGSDPEGVHQLRIGLRRFRSALSIFGSLLPPDQLAWLKAEARWAIQALNPARDWDVFATELLAAVAGTPPQPAFAELGKRADRARRLGQDQARAMLRSERYTRLVLQLGLWLQDPGWRTGTTTRSADRLAMPIAGFASTLLATRHKAVRKRGKRFDGQTADQRHEVRIALKKLRYAVEFFQSLYPKQRSKAYHRRLKSMQDDLGHLNDVAVARRLLADLMHAEATEEQSELAWAAGYLEAWYAQAVYALEPSTRRDWRAFRACGTFWNERR